MNKDNYIYKKGIDKSLLDGKITVPIQYHQRFFDNLESNYINKGEYVDIKLKIDDKIFSSRLYHINVVLLASFLSKFNYFNKLIYT